MNKSPRKAAAKDGTKLPPFKNNNVAAPAAVERGNPIAAIPKEVAKSPNPRTSQPTSHLLFLLLSTLLSE